MLRAGQSAAAGLMRRLGAAAAAVLVLAVVEVVLLLHIVHAVTDVRRGHRPGQRDLG